MTDMVYHIESVVLTLDVLPFASVQSCLVGDCDTDFRIRPAYLPPTAAGLDPLTVRDLCLAQGTAPVPHTVEGGGQLHSSFVNLSGQSSALRFARASHR